MFLVLNSVYRVLPLSPKRGLLKTLILLVKSFFILTLDLEKSISEICFNCVYIKILDIQALRIYHIYQVSLVH